MEESKSLGSFIKKHYMLSTIVIGVVVVVALGALGSNSSTSAPATANSDEAQAAAPQTPAQQVCAMTPQQLRSQAQTQSLSHRLRRGTPRTRTVVARTPTRNRLRSKVNSKRLSTSAPFRKVLIRKLLGSMA